jgi:hypothetical protein
MRSFAQLLIIYENLENNATAGTPPAPFLFPGRLRPHLVKLMGSIGFRALLLRSLKLAKGEVSWLSTVNVKPDGTLEGPGARHGHVDTAAFLEGRVVLVARLLELLVALIGPQLTIRLVSEVWPRMSLVNLDLGSGEPEEKNRSPTPPWR